MEEPEGREMAASPDRSLQPARTMHLMQSHLQTCCCRQKMAGQQSSDDSDSRSSGSESDLQYDWQSAA